MSPLMPSMPMDKLMFLIVDIALLSQSGVEGVTSGNKFLRLERSMVGIKLPVEGRVKLKSKWVLMLKRLNTPRLAVMPTRRKFESKFMLMAVALLPIGMSKPVWSPLWMDEKSA